MTSPEFGQRKMTKLRQKLQISHSDVIPALRYWLDHCNGIAEVRVRIPAKLNFKLRLYCDDDLLYINLFIPRFIITVME